MVLKRVPGRSLFRREEQRSEPLESFVPLPLRTWKVWRFSRKSAPSIYLVQSLACFIRMLSISFGLKGRVVM